MQSTGDNPIANEVVTRCNTLFADRSTWENHWNEIAQRMLPSYSNSFSKDQSTTPGEKRTEYMFDSTASMALKRFAAIVDSLLTPRNAKWHRLQADDDALNRDRSVRLWFEQVTNILFKYRYAPPANFTSQNNQIYLGLGAFGTAPMYIDALQTAPGLRYKAVHLGETVFADNHQGITDTAYRRFQLDAVQAFNRWGLMLPDDIIEKAQKGDRVSKFWFIHGVKPRPDYDPKRLDAKGKPWVSHYVCEKSKTLLEEGGYNSFPYAVPRYEQAPGETYGRSPAMDVLPAVKVLNEEKKTLLKQAHRAVDPVLLTHDDGILDTFSLKPGALNAGGVSSDGRALVHALPVGALSIGKELMDDERMVINDVFLVNLFQILVETPQMTATEVMERTREKGILLAPTVGRQQSEYLGPLIEREIDLLTQQGLIPPMPPLLLEAQGEYRVEYDSPLSRAQRAEEVAGLMRSVEYSLNIANVTQSSEPLDYYDWDQIIPEVAQIQAVPERWMREKKAIEKIRADRQESMKQEQAIAAAPGAAAMVNAVSKAEQAK